MSMVGMLTDMGLSIFAEDLHDLELLNHDPHNAFQQSYSWPRKLHEKSGLLGEPHPPPVLLKGLRKELQAVRYLLDP